MMAPLSHQQAVKPAAPAYARPVDRARPRGGSRAPLPVDYATVEIRL
jgi:hypothetical protein